MADVPYLIAPSHIPNFLKHVHDAQVPAKVTNRYLESAGFTSKNDRQLVGLFKALGFLDGSGVPTDRWKAYRNRGNSGAVLAQAVRECYSGLYAMYPDAHRKDDEAITNWMRSNTNYSGDIVRRALTTFKVLAENADFEADSPRIDAQIDAQIDGDSDGGKVDPVDRRKRTPADITTEAPAININVQLQLQATDDPTVYDAFFTAMKKHLFPDAKSDS